MLNFFNWEFMNLHVTVDESFKAEIISQVLWWDWYLSINIKYTRVYAFQRNLDMLIHQPSHDLIFHWVQVLILLLSQSLLNSHKNKNWNLLKMKEVQKIFDTCFGVNPWPSANYSPSSLKKFKFPYFNYKDSN